MGYKLPDIQVEKVDVWGSRTMTLKHTMVNNIPLDAETTIHTMKYLTFLWGYDVILESIDSNGRKFAEYDQHKETLYPEPAYDPMQYPDYWGYC